MPKTLQQYRTITKLLKLDILKIKIQNQEMQKVLGSDKKQSQVFGANLLLNQSIIKNEDALAFSFIDFVKFRECLQQIGMTPQMFFRMCDMKKQKRVLIDVILKHAGRLKFRLQRSVLEKILRKIDQERIGQIQYENYLSYINAFQINTQKYPFKSTKSYPQVCIEKLAEICKNQSKSLDQFNNQRMFNFYQYKRSLTIKSSLKEVQYLAIFLYFDKSHSFKIMGKQFYNRLKEQILNVKTKKKEPLSKKQNKQNKQNIFDIGPSIAEKSDTSKFSSLDSKSIIKKRGIDVSILIQVLLKKNLQSTFGIVTTFPVNKAFTIFQIKQVLSSVSSNIGLMNQQQFMRIYQDIDYDKKGTVNIFDMAKFYVQNKENNDSYSTIITIFANYIAAKKLVPQTYLEIYKLGINSKIDLKQFSILWKDFKFQEPVLKKIYEEILGNDKILMGDVLIKLLRNHGNFKQKASSLVFSSKGSSIILNQLQNYQDLIKKFPKKSKEDYFLKYSLEKQKNEQRWQTILNNQITTLQVCYQMMKQVISKRKQLKQSKIMWKDFEFGSSTEDKNGWKSINNDINSPMKFLPKQSFIQWLQFDEFLQRLSKKNNKNYNKSFFIQKNLKATDVVQSEGLGNCWFLASLSMLTNHRNQLLGGKPTDSVINNLFEGVYPTLFHIFSHYGIYVFRFFKYQKPVYVIVDGTVPINADNCQLIFGKSTNDCQKWVSLIQKAYAKLHHTYQNIQTGQIMQGITDLTGLFTIKQQIGLKLFDNNQKKDQFWNKLIRWKNDNLMGCSINTKTHQFGSKKIGLVQGHAYTILHLIQLSSPQSENYHKSHRLLCLRNPQGDTQWNGSWSQNQPQLNSKLKKNLKQINEYFKQKNLQSKLKRQDQVQGYNLKQGDGIFLMCFKDWRTHFDNLYRGIKIKFPLRRYDLKNSWTSTYYSGFPKTTDEKSEFYTVNYQYKLEVLQKNQIYLQLRQQDGRLYPQLKYPFQKVCVPLSIIILKNYNVIYMTKFQRKRTISMGITLQKGQYIIIPCTSDRRQSKYYPQFTFQIIFDKDIKPDPKFKVIPQSEQKKYDYSVDQFYRRLLQNNKDFSIYG